MGMRSTKSSDENKYKSAKDCAIQRVEYGQRSLESEHKCTDNWNNARDNDPRSSS